MRPVYKGDPVVSVIATADTYPSVQHPDDTSTPEARARVLAGRRTQVRSLVENLPNAIRMFSERKLPFPPGHPVFRTSEPNADLLDLVAHIPDRTWDGKTGDFIKKTYKAVAIAIQAHIDTADAQDKGLDPDIYFKLAKRQIQEKVLRLSEDQISGDKDAPKDYSRLFSKLQKMDEPRGR